MPLQLYFDFNRPHIIRRLEVNGRFLTLWTRVLPVVSNGELQNDGHIEVERALTIFNANPEYFLGTRIKTNLISTSPEHPHIHLDPKHAGDQEAHIHVELEREIDKAMVSRIFKAFNEIAELIGTHPGMKSSSIKKALEYYKPVGVKSISAINFDRPYLPQLTPELWQTMSLASEQANKRRPVEVPISITSAPGSLWNPTRAPTMSESSAQQRTLPTPSEQLGGTGNLILLLFGGAALLGLIILAVFNKCRHSSKNHDQLRAKIK